MHIERLTKLAELLESHNGFRVITVRGRQTLFDMDAWAPTARSLDKLISNKIKKHDCGTACCAIGLAAQTPWFNRRGLKLGSPSFSGSRAPTYLGLLNWSAVQEFFEIDSLAAFHLFNREEYSRQPTPKQVAARIRALLAAPRS